MAYTEATTSSANYNEVNNQATQWDDNATQWDVSGNTIGTYWDVIVVVYNDATENTPTYANQSGSSPSYTNTTNTTPTYTDQ